MRALFKILLWVMLAALIRFFFVPHVPTLCYAAFYIIRQVLKDLFA